MIDTNIIHPKAIVHPKAKIGLRNVIHPGVIIGANVEIGNDNHIFPYAIIGTEAEHRNFHGKEMQKVSIGNRNIIREFVTINCGTFRETQIAHDCYLLRGSHVGHDSWIHPNVTLSCNVLIGGESEILDGANLGLGAVVHQRSVIGHYAMIGMNSTVPKTREVFPFEKYAGSPIEQIGKNKMKFDLFTPEQIQRFYDEYIQKKDKK